GRFDHPRADPVLVGACTPRTHRRGTPRTPDRPRHRPPQRRIIRGAGGTPGTTPAHPHRMVWAWWWWTAPVLPAARTGPHLNGTPCGCGPTDRWAALPDNATIAPPTDRETICRGRAAGIAIDADGGGETPTSRTNPHTGRVVVGN